MQVTQSERYERLVRQHQDAVLAQMVRLCGNREDAEDSLVEALLAAYRSLDRLQDEAAFRGWLAQISRRVCFRLRGRTELVGLPDWEIPVESPEREVEERETKRCLQSVVESLPPTYREAYLLREVEGFSAEETADRLDLTVAAVKSRLHRARAMVREGISHALCEA